MNTEDRRQRGTLEKGQLWQIEHGYLYIVERGERLVQYKMLNQPEQQAAALRVISIDALAIYLRHNEAQLVRERNAFAA